MKAREKAQEFEVKLTGLVSDLRLITGFEDLYDTLIYLHNEICEMVDEAEQLYESEGE